MTNYDCFSDWAWGHIQDVYGLNEGDAITPNLLEFVKNCAKEALLSLPQKDQFEMFGFTLEQVENGEILKNFYSNYAAEK